MQLDVSLMYLNENNRDEGDDLHRPAEIGRTPIVSVMSHLFQQWRQYKEELNRLISDRVELS
jgi:hypothetical protein